jgi:uncharacterized protein
VVPVTTMLTWQADDGHGLEGVRLQRSTGGLRALGRLVRPDFTASYRLIVEESGVVRRLSVTSATPDRERHLTMNRTEDGYWLLDRGAGGEGGHLDGAVDVALATSPLFDALPIRRLGLHRHSAEHTVPVAFVALPALEVRTVQQTYRTVEPLSEAGRALVELRRDDAAVELVVDADGFVDTHPGLAHRLQPAESA